MITCCIMSDGDYRKISLPKDLVDRAETLVKNKKLKTGYLNVTDMVRDALRMRINTLETKLVCVNHNDKKK